MPGLKELGFLSPDIDAIVHRCRAMHAEWFRLSDRLNRMAQRMLVGVELRKGDNRKLLSAILYIRAVGAYQGAIIHAERGMTTEARYVLRSMLEVVFSIAANTQNADFHRECVVRAMQHRMKLANVLINLPGDHKPDGGFDENKLRSTIAQLKADMDTAGIDAWNVEAIAKAGGLGGHYDTAYRDLSASCHVIVTDLDIHITTDANDEISKLSWGPLLDRVPDVLLMACEFLMIAIYHHGKLLDIQGFDEEYEVHWNELKRLIG